MVGLIDIFSFPGLSDNQLQTMLILGIICCASILFCFIVGEITRNNSQMDKLWSILPIAYAVVVMIKGGFTPRLIVMAALVTIWGVRLTINFGRKGAYSIKFWSGEEDYRWKYLRTKKPFDNKGVWALFDFFFISVYQNVLVLAITFPMLIAMDSTVSFNWIDFVAAGVTLLAIVLETIADEQQWKFQQTKWNMLNSGKKLAELPYPYNLGFNTTGLWGHARHPNYLGEQLTWVGLYVFSIGAGIGIFNWSIFGCLVLILLFIGSSTLAENISSGKYPLYKDYKKKVLRFLPLSKKYKPLDNK